MLVNVFLARRIALRPRKHNSLPRGLCGAPRSGGHLYLTNGCRHALGRRRLHSAQSYCGLARHATAKDKARDTSTQRDKCARPQPPPPWRQPPVPFVFALMRVTSQPFAVARHLFRSARSLSHV
eukprot:649284-Pleurochrysis_carterae.AAC.2